MKLETYLSTHDLTYRTFAAKLGVSPVTVYRWLKGRIPAPDMICAVKEETGGAVTANDFYG